jgi:2-methylcitrate dehydratase PrpD
MNNTNESSAIEAMVTNILDTKYENLDNATVMDAKNRIIDVLGCAIGGANAPGNSALREVITGWGGKKEATIWVHGDKVPAHNVAMLNTIMARSYDFEVMAGTVEDKFFAAHHAASIVPSAFAIGELNKVSGKEVLTSIITGDDTAARILMASAAGPINIGWDGTMTVSHFGVTAATGRLLGLNKKQLKNAFGIVLNMVAGAIQSLWDGATTFKLQGNSDRNGIFAVELAKKGWTGVADPFLSRFGYYNVYAQGCSDPGLLTRELGKKYYGETYYKPYPCGMPNHAAIDAALVIANKNEFYSEDIESIIIYVPPKALSNSYYAKPFIIRDFPHGDAVFSYPFSVATSLLHKRCNLYNYTEEAIHDPKILDIITKIKMKEKQGSKPMSIRLQIKMRDGREYIEDRGASRDWITNPISKSKILEKFWHQIEFSKTVSEKNARQVLDLVDNIEQVDDISRIVRLMAVKNS